MNLREMIDDGIEAGGPGSGWFREKGHVSNAPGQTQVQLTNVKEKKAEDVLQRAGWKRPGALGEFTHPNLPGHMIRVFQDKHWVHEDPMHRVIALGENRVKGEAKRLLAVHLNRILKGRVLGAPMAQQRPQAAPRVKVKVNVVAPAPRPAAVPAQPMKLADLQKRDAEAPRDKNQPAPHQPFALGRAKVAVDLSELDNFNKPTADTPEEKKIESAKGAAYTGIRPIALGGINGSYHVLLDNGAEGAFKPAAEESKRAIRPAGWQMKREIAAYQVAKIVGMTDMVPTTVAIKLKGQAYDKDGKPFINKEGEPHKVDSIGSFQQWKTGAKAIDCLDMDKFDGDRNRDRAAIFDYIMGNRDRHQGNWLVAGGDLHLIDHGFILPRNSRYDTWMLGFVDRVTNGAVKKASIPQSEVSKYADNVDKISARLASLGIEDTAIQGVRDRIANISSVETWGQLHLKHI